MKGPIFILCGCPSGAANNNPPSNCTSLTVEDFQNFLAKYQCIKDQGLIVESGIVGLTEEILNSRITLLNAAIADKQANPASCLYFNSLSMLTSEVTLIVTNTNC